MSHFEANIYSFSMICSKILSNKDPFSDEKKSNKILKKNRKKIIDYAYLQIVMN